MRTTKHEIMIEDFKTLLLKVGELDLEMSELITKIDYLEAVGKSEGLNLREIVRGKDPDVQAVADSMRNLEDEKL